jgi:rod shape-determining protein MreC
MAGQTRMIVVDRGADDGVRADMAVVAWGGAVGRVISVERSMAKVRLISDPNGGAAGVVQRSRAQGIVVGRGDGPMSMLYVPAYNDVVAGDRVVTSGKDGVFPRGFTIGRVAAVGGDPGVSKSISIEPEVDFASLEEVLVVVDRTETGPALAGPGEE